MCVCGERDGRGTGLTFFMAAAMSSYRSACSASRAFCTSCSRSTIFAGSGGERGEEAAGSGRRKEEEENEEGAAVSALLRLRRRRRLRPVLCARRGPPQPPCARPAPPRPSPAAPPTPAREARREMKSSGAQAAPGSRGATPPFRTTFPVVPRAKAPPPRPSGPRLC